jgi:hypothetical protein
MADPSLAPTRRPFNRTLVAMGIAHPQMWISGIVAAQHIGATHLCIYTFRWGYLGAALATVWSNLLALLMLAGYSWAAGLHGKVWGRPSKAALQVGWRAGAPQLCWLHCVRLAVSGRAGAGRVVHESRSGAQCCTTSQSRPSSGAAVGPGFRAACLQTHCGALWRQNLCQQGACLAGQASPPPLPPNTHRIHPQRALHMAAGLGSVCKAGLRLCCHEVPGVVGLPCVHGGGGVAAGPKLCRCRNGR